MATAHGIVVLEERPEKYSITAHVVLDGLGHLYLRGRVADTFPKDFGAVMLAVRNYAEFMNLELDTADIKLRLDTPHGYPLAGASFALTAGMAILASATKKQIPAENCYTGCLNPAGECSPVGSIAIKRRGAAALGFTRLFLPSSQIDLFSTVIAQCPCSSLADAYGITFWNE